jgi:hypothetical protein
VAETMTLVQAQASAIEGDLMKFTAHVVGDPEGSGRIFMLNADEAIRLGESLAQFGRQAVENRKREQEETIRRFGSSP